MQFGLDPRKQKEVARKRILLIALFLSLLVFTASCSYPLAFLFNKEAMPKALGEKWTPKKRSVRSARRIQYVEPVDPNIVKGPLALAQVVDFSLRNNPQTAVSWANMLGAIADLGLARQDIFPKGSVNSSVQMLRNSSPFDLESKVGRWFTAKDVSGTVSYTIWDFGARVAKSESAAQALYAMSYAYNQELQTVIQTVTNDYYSYLYNKAALIDRGRDVEDAALILEAAEKKLQLGIANITDLVQAKTTYLNAQVDFVTQKDSTENALVSLAKNMGMAGNIYFQTQDFPSELPGREFLAHKDDFVALALEQRPELIQYKADILSKKASLTYSILEPLPKISGDLNLKYERYTGFKPAYNIVGMFKVELDFFDGFYYRNKTREAKADLKQARANFKVHQDKILGEVVTYYNNYKNAVEKIEYTQEYLEAAFDEFDVTLGNYKAGTGDIINVMQALTSLSNARTKFTLSVEDLFSSLTNLAYATGSLTIPVMDSDWQGIYQFNEDFER